MAQLSTLARNDCHSRIESTRRVRRPSRPSSASAAISSHRPEIAGSRPLLLRWSRREPSRVHRIGKRRPGKSIPPVSIPLLRLPHLLRFFLSALRGSAVIAHPNRAPSRMNQTRPRRGRQFHTASRPLSSGRNAPSTLPGRTNFARKSTAPSRSTRHTAPSMGSSAPCPFLRGRGVAR